MERPLQVLTFKIDAETQLLDSLKEREFADLPDLQLYKKHLERINQRSYSVQDALQTINNALQNLADTAGYNSAYQAEINTLNEQIKKLQQEVQDQSEGAEEDDVRQIDTEEINKVIKRIEGKLIYDKEKEIIRKLNKNVEYISSQLEKEIKRSLPPDLSVECEVSFRVGSIIMSGTVLLLTWTGGVFASAAKKQLEKHFGQVIEFAVKKVFSRALQDLSAQDDIYGQVKPFDEVKVIPSSDLGLFLETSTQSNPTENKPLQSASTQSTPAQSGPITTIPPRLQNSNFEWIKWSLAGISILMVLQLFVSILVLDKASVELPGNAPATTEDTEEGT